MAVKLIKNIRSGQARLSDQLIAAELTHSGAVAVDDISRVLPKCEPGQLGSALVNHGFVSDAELARAKEQIAIATLMDTVGGFDVPAEVAEAAEDRDRRVGRYVLVSELGAGGMGVVWRAWDEKLSRWVALKQVKVKEPQLIRRFMQEARLLASLSHPHITQVYEVGVHNGKPYLVMELVEGGTPGTDGAMGRKEAAGVVRDAARAVQFAHDHDIVHRDLKPSNLLVSKHDRVFVTDFGLARMREEGNQLTQTGALLGTPAFMAPEQAQGKQADLRTDIYGLGATLYALVQGEPPYTGELVHELVKRVALANPPSIEGKDDLVVVAQKAMERDREDRYESAAELAEDLQRFINDEPIAARPIGSLERVWRRARRNPLHAAGVAAATITISIALGWGGTELAGYAHRAAQISAASEPLAQVEVLSEQIRRLFLANAAKGQAMTTTLQRFDESLEEARRAAPDYAEVHFYDAMAAIWRKDLDRADAAFSRALIDDPEHQEARARRAQLRLNAAEYSPTIIESEDGIRIQTADLNESQIASLSEIESELKLLGKGFAQRRLSEALLYSIRGEFQRERDTLETYLADNPLDMKVRSKLLYALLNIGDLDAIEFNAEEMIRSGQFADQAYFVRAIARANVADYEAAILDMRESLARSREPSDAQWIALWQRTLGQTAAAEQTFRTWAAADPDSMRPTILLSQFYLEEGLPEQAIALLDQQLDRHPGDTYLNYLAGQARFEVNPDAALVHFRVAVEDAELRPDALVLIADLDFLAGRFEAGLKRLHEAAGSGSVFASLRLSDHFLQSGQPALVSKVLADHSEVPLAQYQLAIAAQILGNSEEASARINRAIELDPDEPDYLSYRGRIRLGSGRVTAGKADLDDARNRSPRSFYVHRDAVEGWIAVGDKAGAAAALNRWEDSAPESLDADYYQNQIDQIENTMTETAYENQ